MGGRSFEVGGDIGDLLGAEAEVSGVVHEGAGHGLFFGDFVVGDGLGDVAEAFDDEGVCIAEYHAGDGEAIGGFDFCAAVAVGDFCAGVKDEISNRTR